MEDGLQLEEKAYFAFTMAIRSPITRQKYLQRLAYFMTFLGINDGNIEAKCNILGQKARADPKWLTNNIIKYLQVHRERMENREILLLLYHAYIQFYP